MNVSVKKLFTDVLSVFFPGTCPGCGDYLSEAEDSICWKCWSEIPFFSPVLNHPIHGDLFEGRIPISYLGCFIRFSKENCMRNIMHSIKYDGRKDLARWLGRKFGEKLLEEGFQTEGLIPVPVHPKKMKQRGYNQAEWIALGISDITGWEVRTDILFKSRNTKTQTRMNKVQRMENLKDSFALSPKASSLQGSILTLVDDVLTTGATTEHAWNALKAIPEIKLSALYLCHARD